MFMVAFTVMCTLKDFSLQVTQNVTTNRVSVPNCSAGKETL